MSRLAPTSAQCMALAELRRVAVDHGQSVLGMARLAVGLFAVERYRRHTTPVNDAPLLALLEATCERLECARRIELRESPEIVSPATVGWRRPLILLPFEWREWSEGERRAVLAHEVAHVARGDFAGWLAAQAQRGPLFLQPAGPLARAAAAARAGAGGRRLRGYGGRRRRGLSDDTRRHGPASRQSETNLGGAAILARPRDSFKENRNATRQETHLDVHVLGPQADRSVVHPRRPRPGNRRPPRPRRQHCHGGSRRRRTRRAGRGGRQANRS